MILALEDLQNEIWVDIKGYEGLYQVSNMGRVKSLKRYVPNKKYGENGQMIVHGMILNPIFNHYRYYVVGLRKNAKTKTSVIHRLVAIHFIPNPENKPEVNHIGKDEFGKINKLDNRAISLEWATGKENINHAFDNGLFDNSKKLAKERMVKQNSRRVLNNKTGQIYETVKEAAEDNNLDRRILSNMLRGEYANTTALSYIDPPKVVRHGAILLSSLTGIFYESYNDAASVYGIKKTTLRAMLIGDTKTNRTDLILV